ncbi:hypothetical protein R69776_05180 [Paraburkholderia nemoris]|uniref:Uncharacterized protein n=1 Tax=Paraburkholderia nemoris TaxID=2793076 RepID=A0ABM8SBT8_9BURK|nr:hypothetical protein R75777_00007 [Paraburkholderia nemoris]CAE6800181.1 hypothetical protein R69776_05180 [Paraburkholderia nemoris]
MKWAHKSAFAISSELPKPRPGTVFLKKRGGDADALKENGSAGMTEIPLVRAYPRYTTPRS